MINAQLKFDDTDLDWTFRDVKGRPIWEGSQGFITGSDGVKRQFLIISTDGRTMDDPLKKHYRVSITVEELVNEDDLAYEPR